MEENKDLKNTYNKIARDWNGDHIIDTWWINGTDKFLSLLSRKALVLDVGCAGGFKTNYIKEKGYNVDGIDFSEEMIKDAKDRFKGINFEVRNLYDLEKINKTYDGIFSQAVLLHIPKKDILEVLEKIKLKLNKGGFAYIAVKEKINNGVDEEIKMENDYGYEYERFFSYYTMEELRGYFKKLDMEIVYEKIESFGRTNWINIIGKK
jgi:2-polyprenyl-3-methyl-5-hydroxy-6-metoxy-1,4-benzoquinol methylase